jgi:CHASE3 domain sensor protein
MTPAEQLQEIQSRVAARKREVDKAQGSLDAETRQLKEDFGCSSLADARAKLAKLREEEAKALEEFEALRAKFEKDYAHVLREDSP